MLRWSNTYCTYRVSHNFNLLLQRDFHFQCFSLNFVKYYHNFFLCLCQLHITKLIEYCILHLSLIYFRLSFTKKEKEKKTRWNGKKISERRKPRCMHIENLKFYFLVIFFFCQIYSLWINYENGAEILFPCYVGSLVLCVAYFHFLFVCFFFSFLYRNGFNQWRRCCRMLVHLK